MDLSALKIPFHAVLLTAAKGVESAELAGGTGLGFR